MLLQELRNFGAEAASLNPDEMEMQKRVTTAQRGVKAAFELSWQGLDEQGKQLGQVLSLFAPEVIPWPLVERVTQELAWEEAAVTAGEEQLYGAYLLQPKKEREDCYSLHPLVREFLRGKLEQVSEATAYKRAFVGAMVEEAKQIPDALTLE